MKTQPIFRNLISDLKCRHAIFNRFSPIKPLVFLNCVIVWALLAVAVPQDIVAQSLSSIKSAQEAVEKAQEKVDNAQEEVNKAQKAVDDEIAQMKKEAEKDPKAHGSNPELEKLRKERSEAQEKLDKAKKALDKAKERLATAREKFEEKQRKAMEEALKKKPLPDDKKGLEKYKKDMDSWKNDIWGTDGGEDLKRRIREKIDEKLRRLENNEQSALPERGTHGSVATVNVGGTYALDGPSSQFVNPETIYEGLSSPEIFAELYERLGGEFIIGELTSKGFTGVEMSGRHRLMPGLGFGLNFPSGLELGVQFNRFQTDWTGSFPYTVFPFEGTSAQTFQGSVNRSISGIMTDIDARYFFTRGTVQPYLQAGVRGQWVVNDNTSVNMGNASFSLESSALDDNRLSPYAGAGARLNVSQNAFVQAGTSIAKMPGSGYTPTANISVGWNFGGVSRRDIPIAPPMDLLASVKLDPVSVDCNSSQKIYINATEKDKKITATFSDYCTDKDSEIVLDKGDNNVPKTWEIADGKTTTMDIDVPAGGSVTFNCNGSEGGCKYSLVLAD